MKNLFIARRWFSSKHLQYLSPVPRGQSKLSPISRVLHVDSVSHYTPKGKTRQFRALIVSGSGHGAAGYGVGKGKTVSEAFANGRSKSLDTTKWLTVDLDPDGRLYHNVRVKFKGTSVGLWKVNEKTVGLKCARLVFGIAECFGIKHMTAKRFTRKRSPHTFCHAFFAAIGKHKKPELAAGMRGAKVDRTATIRNYEKFR